MTAITIRPLNQTYMREIGSLSFSATISLKVVSMNRASLLSIPSTERTNRGKFSVSSASVYHAYPSFDLPTSQVLIHWIILVGIRISISKSESNYGVSLDFP